MANLRTAMDAAFWDLNVASPQALIEGSAKHVPGEPFPLDGARASRVIRPQQLSIMKNGFPLGIIPLYAPAPLKNVGSFAIHSIFGHEFSNGWLACLGQFRPIKLISNIKSEVLNADEWEGPVFKDILKHILDKSLYSLGLCSQIALSDSSSLLLSSAAQGERKGRRKRAMIFHKLPNHDILLEAAWPELFLDRNGTYWNVPESISLDCSSLVSESGLRYRYGIHKNGGTPVADNSPNSESPVSLLPGLFAKAAFSYEKSKDLWRQKETRKDLIEETENGRILNPAYDVRLKEPHSTLSWIAGATCSAGYGHINKYPKKSSHFSADAFASFCYTFQHGMFRKDYGDMTRFDARLDLCSASALAKKMSRIFTRQSVSSSDDTLSSPRLNLILQQQIMGPIVFRADSKIALNLSSGKQGIIQLEDFICSLNYSFRLLESGKVVAWYSPKRKEAMIEFRLFEF
ncbi:protein TRIGALACTOSYLDIACYLGLYCEROL 4, chloroplastic-like [Impatiens glandulifera]|uniref:protein TRIGALACTOSYLDIACYLGLYCEROL 4, chloroplastic-like n=1 Tax=Impatiens glandulifera TaxID=253017 RepID=UPI001FB10DDB|nr:protein TRIGALACTOSYLDIACYLGLYCEROL 4, chloroplastic-like [Impatiens glandulifera]